MIFHNILLFQHFFQKIFNYSSLIILIQKKLYFSTYKENGIDYPCLKLKLGEHITIGKEWVNIYKIMRPGEIISTNDVLRMYESEKSDLS